jgi:hypothetical protein
MNDVTFARHDHRTGRYIPPDLLSEDVIQDLILTYGPSSANRLSTLEELVYDGIPLECIREEYKIKHGPYASLLNIVEKGYPIDKMDLKIRLAYFKGFCLCEQMQNEATPAGPEYELVEVPDEEEPQGETPSGSDPEPAKQEQEGKADPVKPEQPAEIPAKQDPAPTSDSPKGKSKENKVRVPNGEFNRVSRPMRDRDRTCPPRRKHEKRGTEYDSAKHGSPKEYRTEWDFLGKNPPSPLHQRR